MAWMKLDDRFHASRKLNSIPKRHRFQAAGLWAIAGSWVSGQGTDGFVPDYMIEQWGASAKTVECLVTSGLWRRESEGFVFDSWLEYNPSKAQTEAERAASAERMRRSRERRRAESAGQAVDTDDVAAQQSEVLQRNTPEVLQRPDPTRPDPTPSSGNYEGVSHVSDAREIEPPSSKCPRHINEPNPPACRACGEARQARGDWEARKARESSRARSAEAHARAQERRRAIEACSLCDGEGYIGSDLCAHVQAPSSRPSLTALYQQERAKKKAL